MNYASACLVFLMWLSWFLEVSTCSPFVHCDAGLFMLCRVYVKDDTRTYTRNHAHTHTHRRRRRRWHRYCHWYSHRKQQRHECNNTQTQDNTHSSADKQNKQTNKSTHKQIHTQVHTLKHTTLPHVGTYTHTHKYTYQLVCAHMRAHTHSLSHTNPYTHTRTHAHENTRTHAHKNTRTYHAEPSCGASPTKDIDLRPATTNDLPSSFQSVRVQSSQLLTSWHPNGKQTWTRSKCDLLRGIVLLPNVRRDSGKVRGSEHDTDERLQQGWATAACCVGDKDCSRDCNNICDRA